MTSDDRLPVVLVVLDGLGDRACEVLDGRTPAEAAVTPVLDALTARGASGLHLPFGPGVATSSEVSHWSMLGFEDVPFPGRSVLEALGVGLTPPEGTPVFHLGLRAGFERAGAVHVTARAEPQDAEDADVLFAALGGRGASGISFRLEPIRAGECLLVADGAASQEVSDSDPVFPHLHSWMRPVPLAEARDPLEAARTARALESWLRESREVLRDHPRNRARAARELPVLDIPVTKWAGILDGHGLPPFRQQAGLSGGAVTSAALYRGLARLLDMAVVDRSPASPDGGDMADRLSLAEKLLVEADFVHVHTKAPDEAGHRKDPVAKRAVIERLDEGLAALHRLADRAVVAVTGDHATPSVGSVLHTGDPTPLVVAGPGVRPDRVRSFGEASAAEGGLGPLRARELLPLLAGSANRPFFRGHRPGPVLSAALPADPAPMTT